MADAYDSTKDLWGGGSSANCPESPSRRALAVTPSDTLDVTNRAGDGAAVYAKSIYIGVGGDVTVITAGDVQGATVLFKAHPIGYMPVQVRRVMNTGTTALNITALYDR